MAVFKCKMCGANLEIESGVTVYECDYCNTKQTIPSLDDEKKLNLFNRANRLRIGGEFDKAASIYENIIAEFPEEAEAYWGLVICNYGIEYVDDPATAKKIPTVHRASFEKIENDENYKMAMEYADVSAQKVYRDEAREIDRIREEILSISKNEQPYDIFICYKETAEDGQRTVDSVLAQNVYEALTDKGYKVFFSRISLEDKLGRQFEPYIFAALNSAKIMLSFGTKYEYFHAVWVKNEWSRFLKLMAKDKQKVLIPCYKDMDAYDLPDEFKALQAQDMGKVGAIQDLVRGVDKIIPRESQKTVVVEKTVVQSGNSATVDSLLKRVFMFLSDGDWTSANEYCEKVLDINPECAEAYLGKLMADLKTKAKEDLQNCAEPFAGNNNYKKAIYFSDGKLKAELKAYVEHIAARNEKTRLESVYNNAKTEMAKATDEKRFKAVAKSFESISGFLDSDELAKQCREKAEEAWQKAEKIRKEKERIAKKRKKIAIIVSSCVCAVITFAILLNTVIIPGSKYNKAVALMEAGKYAEAINAFELLAGYKDSYDKILQCHYENAVELLEAGNHKKAAIVFGMADSYKDAKEKSFELWKVLP